MRGQPSGCPRLLFRNNIGVYPWHRKYSDVVILTIGRIPQCLLHCPLFKGDEAEGGLKGEGVTTTDWTTAQGRRIRNIHGDYIPYSHIINVLPSHRSHKSHEERIVTLAFAIRLVNTRHSRQAREKRRAICGICEICVKINHSCENILMRLP